MGANDPTEILSNISTYNGYYNIAPVQGIWLCPHTTRDSVIVIYFSMFYVLVKISVGSFFYFSFLESYNIPAFCSFYFSVFVQFVSFLI